MKTGLKPALIASVALLFSATPAHAAVVFCDGTISSIALNVDGSLLVAYGSYPLHTVCNVSTSYSVMDKETCKAWFAVIQAAKAQQRIVRVYYDSATSGNPASCSAIVYGQGAKPYFLQTLD